MNSNNVSDRNDHANTESRYKNPLSRSIIIGCLLFTFFICILMGIISFVQFRKKMMKQFEDHLKYIVTLTAERIDVDDLDECIQTRQESEKFKILIEYMDQVIRTYDLDSIVIIKPVKDGDNYDVMQVMSGLLPEEREGQSLRGVKVPVLGDSLKDFLPPGFPEAVYAELQDCHDIHFSISKSDLGRGYNAVKGIYKEDGTPVALLTAALSLEFIDKTMKQYIIMVSAIAVALSVIVTICMTLWLKRRVTDPLGLIERSAQKLTDLAVSSHGKKEVDTDKFLFERPNVRTDDELGALTDSLVIMANEVRSYVHDILTAETKVAELGELANKDALTGIRNKTAYDSEIKKIEGDLLSGQLKEFALAMIDLNYLKKINDNYGHDKGNISIKKLCHMVCTVFTHSPVFRIGGDEFVVLLKGSDYQNYEELLADFNGQLDALAKDDSLDPWEKVSAAIGVAYWGKDGNNDIATLFKSADENMYENKVKMKAARED